MEYLPQPPEHFEPEEPAWPLRPIERPEEWDEPDTDVLPADEDDDGESVEFEGRIDGNLSGINQ